MKLTGAKIWNSKNASLCRHYAGFLQIGSHIDTGTYIDTCTLSCRFVFTMYELVLKAKPTLLVWNYFKLQVCAHRCEAN